MNFGQALEHLKAGGRVRRAGWNGKGMWLALTRGSVLPADHTLRGAAEHLGKEAPETPLRIGAHIDMRAADGSLVIGWLASQTDMLSDDWEAIDVSAAASLTKRTSIGDRVLYRCGGTDEAPILRPAVVVRDWPGYDYVNLQVFIDGTNDDEHRGLAWSDGSPVFTPEERARGMAWRTSAFPGHQVGKWRLP